MVTARREGEEIGAKKRDAELLDLIAKGHTLEDLKRELEERG